jgi:hypothetical protein
MFSIGTIFAAPKETPIPARTVVGTPTIEPDSAISLYVWIEGDGLHVRWTSAGKPVLFSGTLSFDRSPKDLKRILDVGSGWVRNYGDRIVMFSVTSRNGLDGFDLSLQHNKRVHLDLKVDGNDPALDQVHLGAAKTTPAGVPMVVSLR